MAIVSGNHNQGRRHIVAVLDNIRSLYNVGSIFRTADGFALKHLYLCGITGTPGLPKHRTRISKTSLGAEDTVPWSYGQDTAKIVNRLKKDGFSILALEQTPGSLSLLDPGFDLQVSGFKKIAIVVGNELYGIHADVLAVADTHVMIPMLGQKESLNVAVAFGIACAELRASA